MTDAEIQRLTELARDAVDPWGYPEALPKLFCECDADGGNYALMRAFIRAANPAAVLELIARVRNAEARPPGGYSASDIYRILGDPRVSVTISPMKEIPTT